MKVLVCINSVPETTSKINFTENKKYDSTNIQFVINPNDEFGLTRAIWLKEKQNATVDVINVGQSQSDKLLKKCLAIGADNAYSCLLYTSPSPRDGLLSRMPSSA